MGLRERKKQRTRQLVSDTAWRLFAEHGFDRVTVADVAHTADVAPATVFNHFPTKEDLFYAPLEAFGERLVDAVARRATDESAVTAFRRFLSQSNGLLEQVGGGDPVAYERLRTLNQVIADSQALRRREQQALARNTESLASQLAAEVGAPPDDVTAYAAANAMMGVQRALLRHVRQRILADETPNRLAAEVRALADRGFGQLERGIAAPYAATG